LIATGTGWAARGSTTGWAITTRVGADAAGLHVFDHPANLRLHVGGGFFVHFALTAELGLLILQAFLELFESRAHAIVVNRELLFDKTLDFGVELGAAGRIILSVAILLRQLVQPLLNFKLAEDRVGQIGTALF
jgi:hypothetical protein